MFNAPPPISAFLLQRASCYMLHASCVDELMFLSVWMLLFWVGDGLWIELLDLDGFLTGAQVKPQWEELKSWADYRSTPLRPSPNMHFELCPTQLEVSNTCFWFVFKVLEA